MSVNSCFSYVIGFSRKSDACIDGGVNDPWDDNYALSDSGLYIDELPGFPQRFVASLGGNYDIWEKMTNAMENAINVFKVDVLNEILKFKEPSRPSFRGDIGEKSYTTTLSTPCAFQGLRMYSDIIGGAFVLRGFWLFLNVTEWVTISIYDEYDLLYSWNVQSQAGKPKYTAIPVTNLPLGGNYYFLYSTTGSPYNNHLTCNCGTYKWCFNIEHPCFKYSRNAWTEWVMMGGVCGDTLSERNLWGTSRDAYGLVLHGDLTCDIIGSLCSDHSDWTGNQVDFAIANAIWYKTGEFLSVYVRDSEEVSRRTLLGNEQWTANSLYYTDRYTKMINFIAQNYEEDRNECLICRNPFGHKIKQQYL